MVDTIIIGMLLRNKHGDYVRNIVVSCIASKQQAQQPWVSLKTPSPCRAGMQIVSPCALTMPTQKQIQLFFVVLDFFTGSFRDCAISFSLGSSSSSSIR